jgi:uncharacterized protein (TIGR00369 family)
MTRAREAKFKRAAVGELFGYVAKRRTAKTARIELAPQPRFLQQEGRVQGGVLAALADTAAVWLLYPDLDDAQSMTSVEFKLNFLRPAVLGENLIADAKLVKRGRTIALVDVDVSQGGELVAKGLFTYLVFEVAAARRRISSRSRSGRHSRS